ncbi:MAG: EAL domain-containing protein, partial [Thermoanaerobaculia bacterium]
LNPVAERLTGWTAAEAAGKPLTRILQLVDEVAHKPIPDPVERCLREGRVVELPGPALLVRRDGVEFVIRDSVAPIRDHRGWITGSVVVFKDVTELRGMEREVRFLARHDALTGLLNRREFERRLERAIETAQHEGGEHALLYLDLDEFKLVNDTCGHLAGDELLKQVASELARRLRPGDVLARLGGDEFGMLLEDTRRERARAAAEALHEHVAELRFAWEERIFRVGASIGLVPITGAAGGLAQVLSAADAACYVAKEGGRNRVHEYEPDDTLVAERYGEMQWIHRINRAFEDRLFRLYYQPIQPLAPEDGRDILCEVLIRMLDDRGRVISPAAFIAAAERYHLIGSVDRWVVRTALRALAESQRRDASKRLLFAINLSGQSLSDDSFLDYVVAQLVESGVDSRRICFEITETAAISKLDGATRFIKVLREMGCRFVLDDFGTGLSSFAYLRDLPVDFLKIDGEFVRNMLEDEVKRALVESINQIGHVIGVQTIAEWVENRATLDVLKKIGVDYAQGYWIAKPQPLVHDL